MRLSLSLLALFVLAFQAAAQGKKRDPNIADTPPLPPAEQAKKFKLPPGFVIELVAAEPEVKKPINIAFDAKGRLWVTGSEEYPFAAPKDRKPKDTVKILEDFGPDGRARKITTFADGLNIPIGVQPLPDCKSALVFSIPNIYLMTDKDGDGVADERKVLYSGFGFEDTHGMTGEFQYWIDGWIYCCHGFANASRVKSLGDTEVAMQSGNTYRIKPDGSRIEQFTWGQVNPFGLTFDFRGYLYSADCHTRPLYHLLKGAYYPSFGKPHDGLGFGPEMVTHDHGSTAIAGIAHYNDHHFPEEFRDNLFVGNVVTNRINRDRIEMHGASPKGIAQPDFVISEDPWFRPVDIKLGPDGALYVADFYNRIIGHYEVPRDHPGRDREKGRIWRIRASGKKLRPMPDLTKMTTDRLITELGSPNLTTQMMATQVLVARGKEAGGVRKPLGNPDAPVAQLSNAMWVLERIGQLDTVTLQAFHERDGLVRAQVYMLLAQRPKLADEHRKWLHVDCNHKDPIVQRAAAEALAAHASLENVRPLLDLRHAVPAKDTHLLHVVRMSLRDQLKAGKGPLGLDASAFSPKDLKAIADVCLGLPTKESANFLLDYLARHAEDPKQTLRFTHHIVRHGGDEATKEIMALLRKKHGDDISFQGQALGVLRKAKQERGGALNKEELVWGEDVARRLLLSRRAADVQLGIETVGDLKLIRLAPELVALLANPKVEEISSRRAAAALVNIDPVAQLPLFSKILTSEEPPFAVREQLATSLAATNRPEVHEALVKAMEVTPARLQTAIALALAGSTPGGEELLKAVGAGKASPRLLTEPAVSRRLAESKLPNLKDRLANLTKGFPAADVRLLEQQDARRTGFRAGKADAKLGKAVFTKHCAACHQIGSDGNKIGPQLDGIGIRGLDRLLEDILDPNRNIDQAFRATVIHTKGGQIHNGLLLRKDGKVLVLADPLGKELRIPEDDVDEQRLVNLSPMPATFFEAVPEREFYDLVAYLLEQRVKDR